MNFTSIEFLLFLSIVFALYWSYCNKSATAQNLLLTTASLFFYGWVDGWFLLLLIFSTLFNFYTGKGIYHFQPKVKKYLLYLGLIVNIGALAYFKYFNFFIESFLHFFGSSGQQTFYSSLTIMLPLGLSFFTLQAIGYLIDIYNEDIKPTAGLLAFSTFLTYFPKITAGPIERAEGFLTQVEKKRTFDYNLAFDGLRQILWGLFAKLVVSNNCATIADPIFDNYSDLPASTLLAGSFFYAFQIYCDFSGYSNIAIGISKLFGIRLTRNFATPFFATNIQDFWKRWHISLSAWMMHYIFFPLSFTFRKYHKAGLIMAIMITFSVIGLWHGANWTFIVFGVLHGLYFIPLIAGGTINKTAIAGKEQTSPSLKKIFKIAGLFILVMLTLIVFRAENISQAARYISMLFSSSIFSTPIIPVPNGITKAIGTFFLILLLMGTEWVQRNKSHELQIDHIRSPAVRIGIYYTIILAILLFGSVVHMQFLYSQF